MEWKTPETMPIGEFVLAYYPALTEARSHRYSYVEIDAGFKELCVLKTIGYPTHWCKVHPPKNGNLAFGVDEEAPQSQRTYQ